RPDLPARVARHREPPRTADRDHSGRHRGRLDRPLRSAASSETGRRTGRTGRGRPDPGQGRLTPGRLTPSVGNCATVAPDIRPWAGKCSTPARGSVAPTTPGAAPSVRPPRGPR